MYKFLATRVRVDLGNDVFADAVDFTEPMFIRPTLEKLIVEMKRFILSRHGQIVEGVDTHLIFDTSDLTVYGDFRREDGTELSDDELELLEQFYKWKTDS